jgi:hypothetical protein
MSDSILQSFLDNQFIRTDESNHVSHLENASAEVEKLLRRKRARIIDYTLVALDPAISGEDPIIKDVESVIIKHWNTFKNSILKTKDTPIPYIQAVLLNALNGLSKDEDIAAIVWLTGCDIVNYYKLAGQEKVLSSFLSQMGRKVEETARRSWGAMGDSEIDYSLPEFTLTLPEITESKVRDSVFQTTLKAAAVHSAWAQNAGGGENPSQTAMQSPQWAQFFAQRAAKGLSEEINTALSSEYKSMTSVSISIQEALITYFANLTPYLEQMFSSIPQSSKALNRRSDLIWWKEALHSRTLNCSYRSLSPLSVAVVMPVDLAESVPPVYPRSVDFFLKETLRDVLGKEVDTATGIVELLKQLKELPAVANDSLLVLANEGGAGRKSLWSCVANLMKGGLSVEEVISHAGLEITASISFGELSVWLFHSFQANVLANMKSK